ncbi:MAG: peptidoglycan DD-metalloendopeptidase family protein [Alphaproteobacteria bacterium]|nr:peptidoglycan DD-metalloendopeptidase family protein [Alphaproteobacteria bacterium]
MFAGAGVAQETREEARLKLEEQRSRLQSTKGKAHELEVSLQDLEKERERLNARLLETAALIQKSEARMTGMEARLGELKSQEQLVRGSLAQQHGKIAGLLAILQRMGRNPPPVMITHREDALSMVRSAMLLAAAFPSMSKQAMALANQLNELVRVMTEIEQESQRLKAETQNLVDARTRLSGLMTEKQTSLAQRQSELSRVRSAAAEISQSVTSLSELMQKLDQAEPPAIKAHNEKIEKTLDVAASRERLGTAQGERPRVPVEEDPGLIKEAGKPGPPREPEKEIEVAVLAPSATGFGKTSAARIEPAIPFHLAKSKLPRPTSGDLVLKYDEKTQYGQNSKGIVFRTRHSAQITSPCDGWIVYAGPFRSYGQLLIINAGGGYHVLLAGMTRIDVQPGQFVLAAEPVGTMNEPPPTVKQSSEETSPVLYVEFRKDGRPIDPAPWWVPNPRG